MRTVLWGLGASSVVALLWGCPAQPMTCDAGYWHTELRMCVGICNEMTVPRCGETGVEASVDASGCAAGETICGGRCVDTQRDPTHCGRCGNSCSAADGGTATCNAGACQVQCASGSHACSGACVSNDSPTSCGNRCEPCPAASGERATCNMNSCATECLPGFERVGATCEVVAPRPIWPPGTSTVTSLRPTLRWQSAMGVDGARVELCRDRACTMVVATIDATGSSAQPTMDLPRSSVLFWRIRGRVGATTGTRTSPTWQFRTRANGSAVDTAYGVELDVNGDGFTDAAVSARVGRVTVHHGSASGVRTTADATISTHSITTFFVPYRVAMSAGDVNGDGFGDVVIGYPSEIVGGMMGVGCVRLFRGSASGIESTAASSFCGTDANGNVGISVAGVGDVNADGFADVVVGATGASPMGRTAAGSVLVFYGSASNWSATPSRTIAGSIGSEAIGSSVAPSVDLNGDRISDVVVGNMSSGPSGGGNATVWMGSMTGVPAVASLTLSGPTNADLYGGSASSGDFNGDGFGDVAIGAQLGTTTSVGGNAGSVSVYHGSAMGLRDVIAVQLRAVLDMSMFGYSATSPGDTNRDGFDDLIVGAPQNRPGGLSNAGSAFIFRGSSAGLPAMATQTIDGTVMGANFGVSVGGSGDFNGDGFADVIVGASNASPGGRAQAGTATVYTGGASMLSVANTLEGGAAADGFGAVVAVRAPSRARSVYQPLACLARR